MAATLHQVRRLNLGPFRRRIALLRSWQLAGIGGCAGCGIVIAALIADHFDIVDCNPFALAAIVAGGVIIGAMLGLFERLTEDQVARSIDRRSGLEDRLTTVSECDETDDINSHSFLAAVTADTLPRLTGLSPATVYPLKAGKSHLLFIMLVAICIALYLVVDTPLLLPLKARMDITKLKHQAVQVQEVAKPFLKEADRPAATADEKALARNIRRFIHDLQRSRITKQEALERANQLAAQAKQLEDKKYSALSLAISQAQTAGEKLSQMSQDASLQKTDAAKLAEKEAALDNKAQSLQQQIASLQNMLNSAMAHKSSMTKSQIDKIKSQISDLKKQLQQIEISKRAAEMMEKLMALPDYQAAQKLMEEKAEEQQAMDMLQKLQQGEAANQNPDSGQQQMTEAQMKAIADQLDQLAKQLNTDAKMKAYAKALLDAAKAARMGNQAGLSASLSAAFGLDPEYNNAPPDYGGNGRGSTAPGTWVGDHGKLNRTDKSSLLNIKFSQQMITSNVGSNGPETYTEETGPAKLDAKSGIPYQAMLPKYENNAESALSKGDIPPEMRSKVRDYFDSLHQGP